MTRNTIHKPPCFYRTPPPEPHVLHEPQRYTWRPDCEYAMPEVKLQPRRLFTLPFRRVRDACAANLRECLVEMVCSNLARVGVIFLFHYCPHQEPDLKEGVEGGCDCQGLSNGVEP